MSTAARFYNKETGVTVAGFVDDFFDMNGKVKVTLAITKQVIYLNTEDWEIICYARTSEDNPKVLLDKS